MRIAATSDIHWPQYQGLFIKSLRQLTSKIDLFLFAGDLVYRGNHRGIAPLLEKLRETKLECPIFSCFGNDDYDTIKDTLRTAAGDTITFLDDEIALLPIKGREVAIVGTRGVLDQPTYWQSRNIKDIRDQYSQRVTILNKLLAKACTQSKDVILLTHYAPTFVTLKGETQRIFGQMGSKRVEELLLKHLPILAIHGHAHRGLRRAKVGDVRVYNVALPLNRRIVVMKAPK